MILAPFTDEIRRAANAADASPNRSAIAGEMQQIITAATNILWRMASEEPDTSKYVGPVTF